MKKKWLAVLLSFLLPGLGQIYLRKYIFGIILLVLVIGTFIIYNNGYTAMSILNVLIWIFAMIHAAIITNRYNEKSKNKS